MCNLLWILSPVTATCTGIVSPTATCTLIVSLTPVLWLKPFCKSTLDHRPFQAEMCGNAQYGPIFTEKQNQHKGDSSMHFIYQTVLMKLVPGILFISDLYMFIVYILKIIYMIDWELKKLMSNIIHSQHSCIK